ncbi:NitT/TauT family transport system substrate-binding protein [Chitinasiproducens palmae]|uniref:NitT/TauT family transport system substrate-binding protein n=2 Tax=Chitinasiproducens palmae TaxID=1770053 RepID=A0A1H2PW09_9BURK|nr:NitT/TauT family transport system substrate-binding protein [Chitinasiproducens palmae]
MSRHSLLLRFSVVAGALLGLVSASSHVSAADALLPVKIAVIPTLDAGPLLLAKEKGIFAKHGLDASINAGGTGATIIPTVLSGQFGIGYANVVSDLEAIDAGLPLLLVHATYAHPSDPKHDPYRVYVAPNSRIRDAKALAQANIGTSSVRNIAEWTTRKSLENLGVTDFSKLRWTKVTGDDAYATVKNGTLDAVWLPQPTGAAAVAQGLVPILSANSGSLPGAVGGYFITSKAYASQNGEVLRRFNAAIDEANRYATDHPQEGKDAVVRALRFDRKLVDAADLNEYPNDPGLAKLKVIANDLLRYGLIRKLPDVEQIFWHPN